MGNIQHVSTANRDEYRRTISGYAARGFTTVATHDDITTMSKKKPFNWVLAIICLFIPVIGWIALFFMLAASSRGAQVVEISLETAPRTAAAGYTA